jgi:polysaccharide export outer membrane protein
MTIKTALLAPGLALGLTAGLVPDTAAAQNYAIRPGDTLRIEVIEDPNLNRTVLVPPDGQIVIPLAGAVRASGRSVGQVQAELATKLGPNFATPPNVYVSVDQVATSTGSGTAVKTIAVYVMGEANKPGRFDLDRGTTLLQALAATGGFSKFAATKRVQLRRVDKSGVEKVWQFNYKDILSGKSRGGMTRLADGDVIVIPERGLFE